MVGDESLEFAVKAAKANATVDPAEADLFPDMSSSRIYLDPEPSALAPLRGVARCTNPLATAVTHASTWARNRSMAIGPNIV